MTSYLWLLCVLGTALCWGSYGPVIHVSQASLGGAWKPFLLVGVAYFFIAVLGSSIVLASTGIGFRFDGKGTLYGAITGALGAFGALFVILAMKTGGKPVYVMPLIFGLAPVMTVIMSSILHPPEKSPELLFYVGIVLLGSGAALVLAFKPS